MKPARTKLLSVHRTWIYCVPCGLAMCLASCASVETRTEFSAAADGKAGARPDAARAASSDAKARPAQIDAVVAQAVPSGGTPAAAVRKSAAPSKTTVDSATIRDSQVRGAISEEPASAAVKSPAQADQNTTDRPPLTEPPSGAEFPSQAGGALPANGPPLEEGDLSYPINLASAMRLADARPLVIAAAQASTWIAEAQLQRAKVIWVPTLNMGADYIRHDGFGPDFNRGLNTDQRPLNQNVNFVYAGMGLISGFAATDAIFEPLVAKQTLNSRRWDIQTAKNDALLETAKAYFDVHMYRGQYAGALDAVQRGEKLAERIGELSEDLVPKVELARAKRMLAAVQQNAASRRERWRVASANLTQVLRLDPRVVVDPAEHDHAQMTLIDPARSLDDLIPIGLTNRPELSSQQALVGAVAERIRREKGRILLPSIFLSGFQTPNELIQFGAQGFGPDRNLNLWSVRDDFSPQVVWQLEALGCGNLARIKEQRGEQSKAIVELFKAQDAVAADVTRAQARLQSAAVRVTEADRAMREAIITFDGNYEGLAQTKRFESILVQAFRPQEAVVALQELVDSYDQYFATVAEYNRAQFELFHALGYPAIDAALCNPPGDADPTDTSRPDYLPPVEPGPPPATR